MSDSPTKVVAMTQSEPVLEDKLVALDKEMVETEAVTPGFCKELGIEAPF